VQGDISEVFNALHAPLSIDIRRAEFARDISFQILMMFSQAFLPLLLAPLIVASPTQLGRRQYISANDLTSGNCKDVMFLFARGSTEVGNMVRMQLIRGELC
jgi:hypothetical protein